LVLRIRLQLHLNHKSRVFKRKAGQKTPLSFVDAVSA
jgi:hypothetical protein